MPEIERFRFTSPNRIKTGRWIMGEMPERLLSRTYPAGAERLERLLGSDLARTACAAERLKAPQRRRDCHHSPRSRIEVFDKRLLHHPGYDFDDVRPRASLKRAADEALP